MQNLVDRIRKDLRRASDPSKALILQRFFKTGPGQYGEGDVFLGVTVPESRKIAREYSEFSDLASVGNLLRSKVHEARLVGLLILVQKYERGEKGIPEFYVKKLRHVNNWDLVDLTAPNILGAHLASRNRSLLHTLARSANLWERRVAMVATYYFIKRNDFADTLKIAELLLADKHDLIHKASGWMLREVGKRDLAIEEGFLNQHCARMPRTMLRYAIERMPEKKRMFYLSSERR